MAERDQAVGSCPKCNTAIKAGHVTSWCTNCHTRLPRQILDKIGYSLSGPDVPSTTVHPPEQETSSHQTRTAQDALHVRYRDAYALAHGTVGTGDAVKTLGLVVGVIVSLGGIFLMNQMRQVDVFMIVIAALPGAVIGTAIYSIGVMIAAQGQTLLASLDSAVNNSPFLTNAQRAEIMGLPVLRTEAHHAP